MWQSNKGLETNIIYNDIKQQHPLSPSKKPNL